MKTKFLIIVAIILISVSSLFFIIEYLTTDEAQPVVIRYSKGEPMNNSLVIGSMAQKICDYLEMECPDEPQFKANYHEETQSGGFSYFHNGNKYSFRIQDNQLHVRDLETREWKIILKIPPNDPISDANRNKLSLVLDYCNNLSGYKDAILYFYSNDTHNIDNNTCEWKEHVTFPTSESLCVPYIEKAVFGEDWSNMTHYFDSDSCTWKVDQNYDTVNSKSCPQFCPKDIAADKIDDMQEIIIDENKGGNDYGIVTGYGFSYSEYPTTRNLDAVFQNCESWERARAINFTSPDGTKFAKTNEGYTWFNSTHYIDNNICDFIPMKKHIEDSIIRSILEYCGSSHKLSYDNPYEHWFANETHYIDADTCLWQHLDDGISLVLPDDWKIVYSNPSVNSWRNNQMNDTDLQSVMDSCATESSQKRMRDGLSYSNGTHIFMNHGCEWKKIGKFMGN